MIHARADYMRIQDPENKIPADEPVFLIRAQDALGAATLKFWCDLAGKVGVDRRTLTLAREHFEKFRKYRETHKVKLPDA